LKTLVLLALIIGAMTPNGVAAPQTAAIPGLQITSAQTQEQGAVTLFRGKVVVKTNDFVLEANEVDFHSDTRELEARGSVSVQRFDRAAAQSSESTKVLDAQIVVLRGQLDTLLTTLTAANSRVRVLQNEISQLEAERTKTQNSTIGAWSFQTETLRMLLPQ
jgi:lipopolysaccharide assembly outer membrane protein LptD (OstA)